jgi:hypothetical protein
LGRIFVMKTQEAPATVINAERQRFFKLQDTTALQEGHVRRARAALEAAERGLAQHLQHMADIVDFLRSQDADEEGEYAARLEETKDAVKTRAGSCPCSTCKSNGG